VIAEKLLRTKAEYIRGYPDPMFFIAKYLKENNIQIKKFKAVNLTGNTLFPDVRKLIEEVFQAPVFDSYSCEAGAIVFECPTHKCYHSCNEYAISEIQSEKSGSGRLITTDLLNYAVPFIRYDSQDILSAEENSCSCGRNLMPIRTIEGRDSDILITPKGKYLIVHNFTGYFEWIESVDQFQIVQQTKNEFLFRLKINNNFSDKIQNEIHKYWMDYIDDSIVITIETVKEIPLTSSGKRRFLIRDKRIAIG
jgi:phenylacetate-CoA ligase